MPNANESAKKISMRFFYYSSCFIASVLVFSMYLQVGINLFPPAKFGNMVYGMAAKPYVYRALVPFGIRTVASIIPIETKLAINEKISRNDRFKALNNKWHWEKYFLTEYLIGCIFVYCALIGFYFSFRYLFKTIYEAPDKLLDLISLTGLIGLPIMFKYTSFIYDFSTLFLFTFSLAFMAQKKWVAFFIVFTLACFNKETTILLTMLFVIYFYCVPMTRLDKLPFMKILSAQIVIYLMVRAILNYFFLDNPGKFLLDPIDVLIRHNLSMSPYTIEAVMYLFIALMVLYKWGEKPIFLKCGLWILPPLVSLCLFFGFLDELRDYYEAYPIVLLLMAHTLGDILGWKATSRIIPSNRLQHQHS